MNDDKRMKIGFFKAVQGAFTEQVIADIKERLAFELNAEVIEADFRRGVLIDGKVYVDDLCLNDLDVYFWHDTLWPAKTGSDSYYIHLLRAIGQDVAVINTADSTEATNDKLRAHEILRRAGLPVSEYALVSSEDKAGIEKAFRALGGNVLVKPRFGGWGKGIVRCTDVGDLQDIIELSVAASGRVQQFLLEKFYDNDPKGWVSVSMVGQSPVIGYRKPLAIGSSDWKVYDPDKLDGRGERSVYIKPSDEIADLAKRAQSALGKHIVGFDFIATPDGYKIVDENSRPGLYAHCLEQAGVDLVQVIIGLIADTASVRQR
jgi:glutathione synthase/RimK-type ligase-like ATP-grasp enzyme